MKAEKPERKHLELEVTDFGPIARAKIELRPLTVFVGPSNTGKSYMAILVYALHKFFRNNTHRLTPGANPYFRLSPDPAAGSITGEDANRIKEWAVTDVAKAIVDNRTALDIPPEITNLIWNRIARLEGVVLSQEIARCFAIDSRYLKRQHSSSNPQVCIRLNLPSTIASEHGDWHFLWSDYNVFRLNKAKTNSVVITGKLYDECIANLKPIIYRHYDIKSTIPEFPDLFFTPLGDDEFTQYGAEQFISSVAREFIEPAIAPLLSKNDAGDTEIPYGSARILLALQRLNFHYLPADRSGVMHAHQVVVRSLIRSAARGGLSDESPLPALSGVLADFLEGIISIADRAQRPSLSAQIAHQVEKEILRGIIKPDELAIDYPAFSYQPAGGKQVLPLMNTSSMISELAPVVLYLRHIVQTDDTLIIEEPEAHLHPAMQREFTRQIATMVHAGIRVIITTHSEWVLEEIANLVYLSDIPQAKATDVEHSELALTRDEVGVWLFEPKNRPRGSVVREVPLNVDTGSFDSGFNEVSRELYNKWASIVSLVNGGTG